MNNFVFGVEMNEKNKLHYPWVSWADVDGFLGIFIDNLVNMILIVFLCKDTGIPDKIIFGVILPGAALSVLSGNIFYSYMARKLAHKENRTDVTALPYGINTLSLIAFHFMIIKPVALATGNPVFAWKVGIAACFLSGIVEGLGAFIGEKVRKLTPSPALLAAIAGIALVFLGSDHFIQSWAKPFVFAIPFAIILLEYFSKIKFPFKIPAGIIALTAGTLAAWLTGSMNGEALSRSLGSIGLQIPVPQLISLFEGFSNILPYILVAVMMGIISFVATIQNLESAKIAGDNYPAFPAMMMNGIGTLVGAVFGNPFPTTVYIGHPGWKAIGARSGYSILNGSMMTLVSLTGIMHLLSALVPKEAGYPILIWVGLVITSQAFSGNSMKYGQVIALGLIPAIAGWGGVLLSNFGVTPDIIAGHPTHSAIVALGEGSFISAMLIVAMGIFLLEKQYLKACFWTIPAIIFSFFGLIHSKTMGIAAGWRFSVFYFICGLVFLLAYLKERYLKTLDENEQEKSSE